MSTINLYEAKTGLSQLVERASQGEEIVIAKAGRPMAKLGPITKPKQKKRPFGGNPMGITYIAPDFDEPVWTDKELDEFGF